MSRAKYMRDYRARKKKENSGGPDGITTDGTGNITLSSPEEVPPSVEIDVDVSEAVLPHKPTLKEKLSGLFSPPSSSEEKKTARSSGGKQNNLLSTVLPTVLASLIATYAQNMLPEEYRPCAPSREEVNGIIAPLLNIVARRIAVTGKASKDAIDLTNALICSLVYGTRAYITYTQIRNEKRHAENVKQKDQQPRSHTEQETREYKDAPVRAFRPDTIEWRNGGSVNGDAHIDDGSETSANPEAKLFADMFRRDKQGRAKLGLLPATV